MRWLQIVALCLPALPTWVLAADADEAWIEAYMSRPGQSAGPAQMRRGYRIAWRDLGRFVEVPVKVTTDSGRTHRGYIERVDAASIELRSELYGGYATLVLRQDQVRSTELE